MILQNRPWWQWQCAALIWQYHLHAAVAAVELVPLKSSNYQSVLCEFAFEVAHIFLHVQFVCIKNFEMHE